MNALTIVYDAQRQIKPLIEAAIENELRLLEAGLRKTKANLQDFESRYRLTTTEFLERFEKDELKESVDFEIWIGESRLFDRLSDKIKALRGIRFEN
ncbi:MAG: hypothetical protein V2B19_02150 [Pseudomonadota bacterium]